MKTPIAYPAWLLPSAILLMSAVATCADETSTSKDIPAAPPGTFAIVVLPDSQDYLTGRNENRRLFHAEIQWIIDHRDAQRIVFVSHVGDVVQHDAKMQWNVAAQEMGLLHGRVPYAISVGNHDMQCPSGDSSLFQATFPASKFADFPWYGGPFKNNANSYQLFSAEGCDFIILHLECNAPDPVLKWANKSLADHRDRRAIDPTHVYLGAHQGCGHAIWGGSPGVVQRVTGSGSLGFRKESTEW